MTAPTDAELLASHCAGDPDAFAELVRRHRDRLWAVALRTTGDPEEAADAVQDALISAYRRADSFRGDAAVTTWLHRIVVNASLDRLRRRAVRPWTALPEEESSSPALVDESRLADPRAAAESAETTREVRAALDTLPPDQRAAIVLVDLEGWSVEDAASVLECPVGTVKSRCFRGRAKLAERLAHLRNPDGDSLVTPPDHEQITERFGQGQGGQERS
ncbi:MAG: RNA polymerase sigma factor SigM [Candidatus Nanopelagicales bacterium]